MTGDTTGNVGIPPSKSSTGGGVNSDTLRDEMALLMRESVRALGDGSVKAGIGRMARAVGLPERRVRAYYHREVPKPLAAELLAVRQRARQVLAERARRMDAEMAALQRLLDALGDAV